MRPVLGNALRVWAFLLVVVFSACLQRPALAEQRIALVIGNSAYGDLQPLRNPSADAQLMERSLQSLDFHVVLAVDSDRETLRRALRDFADRLAASGGDAIAVFYYAGHGIQLDGINYLIPTDAKIKAARDVIFEGVSLADILSTIEEAHGGTNIIILDACRDNPFQSSKRGAARGLAQINAPNGSLIAYSTAPGQVAEDGSGANSPYSEALARQLLVSGLTIEQVFKSVRVAVSETTRGRQVPWEEQSLVREVMLAGPGANAASGTMNSQAQSSVGNGGDTSQTRRDYFKAMEANTIEAYDAFIRAHPDAEEAKQALIVIKMLAEEKSWRDAEQRNTVGAYKIFLAQHPDGTYADSARTALAALEAKGAVSGETAIRKIESPAALPQDNLILAPGYDAYGYDMAIVKGVTFDDCQKTCQSNGACQAVSYSLPKSWCFLKERAGILIKNSSAQSAYRAGAAGQIRYSSMEIVTKSDIPGSDIARIKNVDFLGCLSACESEPSCRAFSFVRKKNDCWLKSASQPLMPNSKVDSGIR